MEAFRGLSGLSERLLDDTRDGVEVRRGIRDTGEPALPQEAVQGRHVSGPLGLHGMSGVTDVCQLARAERPRRGGSDGLLVSGWQRSEEHTSELQSLMRISYA